LLCREKIDTSEQLAAFKTGLDSAISELTDERKHLRNDLRRLQSEQQITAIKSEISDISKKLAKLRKEVKLCNDIETRTAKMKVIKNVELRINNERGSGNA
jgi:cell division protein FtsL